MTGRWWAPTRATVDPDAVVLALLQPDGDSKGDLGATLLAVHRAGAAACETVSKGAVPSELGLVGAMSEARHRFAGQVVDAAAHSMEARYAGLFVRDFLDDAEQGALHIYRTAVSKGVSPPIAASRAAAVYGVPGRQMGRYVSLAVDPKTNPIALTDAADRCLLTYVAKTVEDEADSSTAAEVSKATPQTEPTRQRTWDPGQHPRDDQGMFAELKTGLGLADPAMARPRPVPATQAELDMFSEMMGVTTAGPTVATEPVIEGKQGIRARRASRLRRATRLQALQQAAVTPAVTQETTARVATAQAATATARTAMAAKIQEVIRVGLPPEFPADKPRGRGKNSAMAPSKTGTGTYTTVGPRSFFLPMLQSQKLKARMGGPDDQPLFRMHHLDSLAITAEMDHDDPTGVAHAQLDLEAQKALIAAYGTPNRGSLEPPQVTEINIVDDLGPQASPALIEAYLSKREHDLARKSDGRIDATELTAIQRAADYRDHSQMLLVKMTEPDPSNVKSPRPVPTVDEYYINHGLKGRVEVTGEDRGIEIVDLDPDQAYVRGKLERFYDKEHRVFVNRYEITPISDVQTMAIEAQTGRTSGFGKALDTKERTTFNQLHPRSQGGQFTDKVQQRTTATPTTVMDALRAQQAMWHDPAEQSAKQTRTEHRVRRSQRANRSQRQAVLSRQQMQPVSGQLVSTEQTARTAVAKPARARTAMAKVIERVAQQIERPQFDLSGRPLLPPLADGMEYRLFTPQEFNQVKHDAHGYRATDPRIHLALGVEGKSVLQDWTPRKADDVIQVIKDNVAQQIGEHSFQMDTDTSGMEQRFRAPEAAVSDLGTDMQLSGTFVIDPDDDESIDKMTDHANKLMQKHPNISWVEMTSDDPMARVSKWRVFYNVTPIKPMIMVVRDPNEVSDSAEVDLVHVNDFTVRDSVGYDPDIERSPKMQALYGQGGVLNARIAFYQVKARKYQDNVRRPGESRRDYRSPKDFPEED